MKTEELSLQQLYKLIQTKADLQHTHTFEGSIENALKLGGISYDKYMRNDISSQAIDSHTNRTDLSILSKDTKITFAADQEQAEIIVQNKDMLTNNLQIKGQNNNDVIISLQGGMLINGERVLTAADSGEISGLGGSGGTNIIMSALEPAHAPNGSVWAKVLDSDNITDNNETGTAYLYSVPIGTISLFLGSVIPDGWVLANGELLSRTYYGSLWDFVKTKTLTITDSIWQAKKQKYTTVDAYSLGDGISNFRIPNLPTNAATSYIIKAYDDLTVKDSNNINRLLEEMATMDDSRISAGIGYVKYYEGTLIQYGTAIDNVCRFSIEFKDTNYAINTFYTGIGLNIFTNIKQKTSTKCFLNTYNSSGAVLTAGTTHDYIAIGRWK